MIQLVLVLSLTVLKLTQYENCKSDNKGKTSNKTNISGFDFPLLSDLQFSNWLNMRTVSLTTRGKRLTKPTKNQDFRI